MSESRVFFVLSEASDEAHCGPRYHNSVTSSRSHNKNIDNDSTAKRASPAKQHLDVVHVQTPLKRNQHTMMHSGQDTYEYIDLDTSTRTYDGNNRSDEHSSAAAEYDMEQPTHNALNNAVDSEEMYLDIVRSSNSHEFPASTAANAKPNAEEEIYFKDNDAYEQ